MILHKIYDVRLRIVLKHLRFEVLCVEFNAKFEGILSNKLENQPASEVSLMFDRQNETSYTVHTFVITISSNYESVYSPASIQVLTNATTKNTTYLWVCVKILRRIKL